MKRINTLKKNYEFKNILQKGKWYSGKYLTIHILNNNNKEENRIGFVVSKKSGNSVFRNRTRRIIRQAYFELEKNINKGYQMIFIWKTKNTIKSLRCNEIYDDMNKILNESGIIK